MLTLEEQLNVICDELANAVVQRYLSNATPRGRGIQLLPLEKVAIMIKGEKLTTDAGQEVWYALRQEKAQRFYTRAIVMKGSTNTGGLGWTQYKFDQVSWKSINATLRTSRTCSRYGMPNNAYAFAPPDPKWPTFKTSWTASVHTANR
jgi:hypothetical protein